MQAGLQPSPLLLPCPLASLARAQVKSLSAAGGNTAVLVPALAALRSCASIFFLLNAIELPEYFGAEAAARERRG